MKHNNPSNISLPPVGDKNNLAFFCSLCYILVIQVKKAFSSAGRAAALQAAGHRFESGRA